MFNVYPVELHYTKINMEGILSGIPHKCIRGFDSINEAQLEVDRLQSLTTGAFYTGFEIKSK